jgi:hypothetical protein
MANLVGNSGCREKTPKNLPPKKKTQMGNLVVLGTAVQKKIEAFYSGLTPLKVDYRERAVATGKKKRKKCIREKLKRFTEGGLP